MIKAPTIEPYYRHLIGSCKGPFKGNPQNSVGNDYLQDHGT